MMKLKDFKLLIFLIFFPVFSYSQVSVFGKVNDKQTSIGLASVEIYNELGELLENHPMLKDEQFEILADKYIKDKGFKINIFE